MKLLKENLLLFISLLIVSLSLIEGCKVSEKAGGKKEDVLLKIGGKNVTLADFLSIYKKNNPKGQNFDKKNLDEYLDLFINFKLKVREAEDSGLDTLTSFKTELNGYRDQLAKPYFTDETTIDRLVKEAYDREHWDLRVSHIFSQLKPDALPEDTLAAFQKMTKIKERLVNGESFEKIVVELSDDPTAKDQGSGKMRSVSKGNRGDLGYFTVFDMVYPFESAAYNTQVGQVSKVVRTDYGYHLIKVTGRRESLGKVQVAHIFKMFPKDANHNDSLNVKRKIDSVYQLLRSGLKWDDIVKVNSDDKGSASKSGLLPEFGVNRMVPEFISEIYKLKNIGDISEPMLTPYGWHIIKLIKRKTQGKFEDEKADLKQRVNKDSRQQLAKDAIYAKIRKEYNFTEFPNVRDDFYKVVTDSVFKGKWDPSLASNLVKPMFKLGTITVTQTDFTKYLAGKQKKRDKVNLSFYVDMAYKDFVNDNLIKFENANLETKYPDFKALMDEYKDGILLFDLTDQKVWSKAVKDTIGLKDFYDKNKNNYMWDERVEASVYMLKNPQPAKAQMVRNFIKDGLADKDILKEINTDSLKVLTIESGKFSRKDNKYIDAIEWNPGISANIKIDSSFVFANIIKVLKPEPKALNEARGLITADYQNYLEKIWIADLRQKYPVTVYKNILQQVK
ncbi:MAG: peptidylprolyl isomerase [Bacteroidetes bacterium]|nr:peptidylprolyl isomerase [Bacteroidota bacterium]